MKILVKLSLRLDGLRGTRGRQQTPGAASPACVPSPLRAVLTNHCHNFSPKPAARYVPRGSEREEEEESPGQERIGRSKAKAADVKEEEDR
ncbi:hypothetical protein E2C01_002864 [Portunus trituberculatus]|uniref:Uncharacterized protein n=1 Tax=Portunus trituberculatus TaxID=210409 RepID=A0A5B7CKL2_PORTR|nr:hypothetical protein [Portunus trituberculatus]